MVRPRATHRRLRSSTTALEAHTRRMMSPRKKSSTTRPSRSVRRVSRTQESSGLSVPAKCATYSARTECGLDTRSHRTPKFSCKAANPPPYPQQLAWPLCLLQRTLACWRDKRAVARDRTASFIAPRRWAAIRKSPFDPETNVGVVRYVDPVVHTHLERLAALHRR